VAGEVAIAERLGNKNEKNMPIVPVILSGGSGSRLWPVSRLDRPKQLIPGLVANENNYSLLQLTLQRLSCLGESATVPMIVCNEEHRFQVADQLEDLGMQATIVLEPVGRNTAPAIAVASLLAEAMYGKESILFVAPSDHVILDLAALSSALGAAATIAGEGKLVTFGIVPDRPETGFGYIHAGKPDQHGFAVDKFVEKPDLATAQDYLSSGEYYWNSGMFMLPTRQLRDELEKYAPKILQACEKSIDSPAGASKVIAINAAQFRACPADSIDYAVMEKTELAMMVPLDAGWSDAGTYAALLELGEHDADGNLKSGDVVMSDCKNSYIRSQNRLVTAVGLEGITVVETSDAVFVAPVGKSQDVKNLVSKLVDEQREVVDVGTTGRRPWGTYEVLSSGEGYLVKVLTVLPGAILSLQSHNHRSENSTIVQGVARVTLDEEILDKLTGEGVHVPAKTLHRIENPGTEVLRIVEVQMGAVLEETDIIRYEDTYGRNIESAD
jgi:mannose-1-phosphate guanylyltransferase/mannose-6-phosphate isomerase